ncbi:MAG: OmpA family protein [Oleispira sp.]|nr:OmpA family protein [Oleispira sp.]MBL4880434.1 OmpA family protein [Oleispira sp.]
MNIKKIISFTLVRTQIVRAIFLLAAVHVSAPLYAETAISDIRDQYYIGAGLGLSFLQPALNDTSLVVSKDSDTAYKLSGGYQLNDHWAAEIFFADMGQARISSNITGNVTGLVGYQYFGVGGLYGYPISESWDAFVTAGAGLLKNRVQLVTAKRAEEVSIYSGLGVVWKLAETWNLRAEYDYYGNDAQMLSFNIVKRFGSAIPRRIANLESQIKQQNEDLSTTSKNIYEAIALPAVKQKNCDGLYVDFNGIYFPQGSIELSKQSQQTLDVLALDLLKLPKGIRFEIRAHADDVGSELYNSELSSMRARVLRDYLAKRSISLGRIDAYGYGEWVPVNGSRNKADREINRRVELILIGVDKYVEDISTCPEFSVGKTS